MESAVYDIPITFEDFVLAQRLYRSYRPLARVQMVLNIALVFVLAGGMLILGIAYHQQANHVAAYGWWTGGVALAVYGCFRWRLLLRRLYRQAFPKTYAGITLQLRWTDEKLIYTAPGLSESRYCWKVIQGVAQDDHTVLLMLSKKTFLMVPRRSIPAEALDDLIARIAEPT